MLSVLNLDIADDIADIRRNIRGTGEVENAVKPFDIVRYGDKAPGIENHHGVLDVWAKHNIPGYVERAPSSTSIALTGGKTGQHAATKAVYRD